MIAISNVLSLVAIYFLIPHKELQNKLLNDIYMRSKFNFDNISKTQRKNLNRQVKNKCRIDILYYDNIFNYQDTLAFLKEYFA